MRSGDDAGDERHAQPAIDDDADRTPALEPADPAGEQRIVGHDGIAADHDGVVRRAQQVRAGARRFAGDPAALAGGRGDAAVERGRELQGDERPAVPQAREEAGIDLGRLARAKPGLDRDPGRAQPRNTLAGDARVGVLDRQHDARHPRGGKRIGAGRRLAPMAARLEAHIGGCAAGTLAGPSQSLGLAVRPAAGLRPAAAYDLARCDDDAADGRIGPHRAEPALRQTQRRPHVREIALPRVNRSRRWRQCGR